MRILVAVLALSATTLSLADTEDRFEKMNRTSHRVNEFFDSKLMRPVARGYVKVVPRFVRARISKFFSNVDDVNVMVNDLMQGKVEDSLTDAARLLLNSTIGLGGLFDPATRIGLEKHEEDWGQTFAVWGAGSGSYVVLPALGPSTMRDSVTKLLDSAFNPLYLIDHIATRNTLVGTDLIQTRANLLNVESFIIGDKYIFYRDAYLQRREFLVKDGEIEDTFDDDY